MSAEAITLQPSPVKLGNEYHSGYSSREPSVESSTSGSSSTTCGTFYYRLVAPPPGLEYEYPPGHRVLVPIDTQRFPNDVFRNPDSIITIKSDISEAKEIAARAIATVAAVRQSITAIAPIETSNTMGLTATASIFRPASVTSSTNNASSLADDKRGERALSLWRRDNSGVAGPNNSVQDNTITAAISRTSSISDNVGKDEKTLTLHGDENMALARGESGERFGASRMAFKARHLLAETEQRTAATRNGQSANYEGDPTIRRNQGVTNLPNHLNHAFWITGLPPDVTTRQLCGSIRGFGRVYATVINPPEDTIKATGSGENTRTSAAKLAFFDLPAAQAFYQAYGAFGWRVGGYSAKVMFNRIGMQRDETAPEDASRVIVLRGPKNIVNYRYLAQMFGEKIAFDVDVFVIRWEDEHDREAEFHFGSWRAQAEAAVKMLRMEKEMFPGVRYRYGFDPCAGVAGM